MITRKTKAKFTYVTHEEEARNEVARLLEAKGKEYSIEDISSWLSKKTWAIYIYMPMMEAEEVTEARETSQAVKEILGRYIEC